NTFLWNAPAPGGDYKFEVDVRDATEQTAYDVVKNVIYTRPTTGCASAGLSASPTSPGATGASVTFTGTSTGCANPTYRFWIRDPGRAWSMVQDYSAATTHTWVQTGLAGSYSVEVDVRDASETVAYDFVSNMVYVVAGCSAAGISGNPTSPTAHGTTITLTGTATCPGTATYKFWIRAPGGSWQLVQNFTTANTFSWTPASAGTYYLEVDVRDQGGTDSYEKVANLTYSVT
ncbi:MAG TPA: triple tyrosine motif-containing protein, partial [Acidimicrobiales bacterium]